MTITIQLWMIIRVSAGLFFPMRSAFSFRTGSPKAETMSFTLRNKKQMDGQIYDKGQQKTAIAHFSHRDGQLEWTLNFGDQGMTKIVNLGSRIAGFDKIDWKSVPTIGFDSGERFTLIRQSKSLLFESKTGQSYRMVVASKQSQASQPKSALTIGQLTSAKEAQTGSMVGWTLFPQTLVFSRGDVLGPKVLSSDEPGAVLLRFFDAWMTGNPQIARYFSPKMDTDALKIFHKEWRTLGSKIQKITLHGYVQAGGNPKMRAGARKTFETFQTLFGEHERVYFLEINSKVNDCFVLLDKINGKYTIKFVASQWAEGLVPDKYKRKP